MKKLLIFILLISISGIAATQSANNSEYAASDLESNLDKAFNQAEMYEENLTEINKALRKNIPKSIRSIVLGSDVNVKIGEAVLGVKTDKTGITGLDSEGLEDPEMNITTTEQTVIDIANSETPVERFREAFHGDGINIETNSLKTTVIIIFAKVVSGLYGFLNGLIA